jgi:pimeloyl-ACP methyl ester carboxylesterase
MRAAIVVADSVTALDARHAGAVLVSGSHGGLIAARYAAAAGVRAAVFNDAGIGLDDAGIAGLTVLQSRASAMSRYARKWRGQPRERRGIQLRRDCRDALPSGR